MLLLAVASGNFPLAQFVERLDTQTEGLWFKSLQWSLIYVLHIYVCVCLCVNVYVCECIYVCLYVGGNIIMIK